MALQCPTADVRCITFGSPRVGNAAFCEAFKWVTTGALMLNACLPQLPWVCVACLAKQDSGHPAPAVHLTSPAGSLLAVRPPVRIILLLLCVCTSWGLCTLKAAGVSQLGALPTVAQVAGKVGMSCPHLFMRQIFMSPHHLFMSHIPAGHP